MRQQALPYIYGYKKQLNETAKSIKDVTRLTKPAVSDLLINYKSNIDLSEDTFFIGAFKKDEERRVRTGFIDKKEVFQVDKEYKEYIAAQLYYLIADWWTSISNELNKVTERAIYNSYDVGIRDGKQKLINAIKKYQGKYKKKTYKIVKAIRAEKVRFPAAQRPDYESRATSEVMIYTDRFARNLSKAVAAIIVSNKILEEDKENEIEKVVESRYQENKEGNTTAKALLWLSIPLAIGHYYSNRPVNFHTWVVDNPQDTPCIIAAGEIVIVGEPFSNGYYWGGDVHKFCQCTTVPVDLDDEELEEFAEFFGLDIKID